MKNIAFFIAFLLFTGFANAQSIEGLWHTGVENTIVNIKKVDNNYVGEIHSSDNPQAVQGKIMLRDITQSKNEFRGEIFIVKRKQWFNAKFNPKEDELIIIVSAGLFDKTIKWKKI